MDLKSAFDGLNDRDLWLILIGVAVLAAATLPRLLAKHPLSVPLVLVCLGALSNPLGLEAMDPRVHGELTERLTELTVIVSLMGAGLKIDRPIGWKRWNSTWRLLGITMILSIIMVAFVGWAIAAFVPAAAILLGACVAPTDPVLASDVQVGPPGSSTEDDQIEHHDAKGHGKEDEVRFALTSEAGLNDGLSFPFTNLAIAMVVFGTASTSWLGTWLLMDVFYQVIIGVLGGLLIGKLMAKAIMAVEAHTELARAMVG
ncbi:MAG: cation:proton antiporter, partial [Bacteroidota bacterium]|nr:cation:proton antiporter [Bacteroidota bacterium]